MADNLTTGTTLSTVPSGTVIATDDATGVHYQKVKLVDGTDASVTLILAGGGVEANALRVTIASDSTGVVSVDDNGGALTVDGTVAATQSGTWTVTGTGGSFPVTDSGGSLTVDNGGTFAVQATIAAGATAIAKAEDVASADADVGVPAMAVRKATPANVSGTDGDYEFLQVSAGRLWTSATIDAALPAGANAIGKLASNTGVTIGAVELAAAQTLATVTTVTTVSTVTSVTAIGTSVTPGTSAAHLGKAEDAVAASGDTGVAVWGVRRDTPASNAAAGDYVEIPVSGIGSLWTTQTPNTTGGLTTYHLVSAASTNLVNVKSSAGQLYGWFIYNSNTSARKLCFHNSAGAPTAGASIFFTIVIPPTSGANVEFNNGIAFSTGISISTVTGLADNDTAAVAVNDLIINLFYK